MTGTGVNQAARQLAHEHMIQTSLIATDAGVDLIGSVFGRFFHEFRVCQKRTGHRDHIRITTGQDLFGYIGHIDSV